MRFVTCCALPLTHPPLLAACEYTFMISLSHSICSFLSVPNRWFVNDKRRTILWPWCVGGVHKGARFACGGSLDPSPYKKDERMKLNWIRPEGTQRSVLVFTAKSCLQLYRASSLQSKLEKLFLRLKTTAFAGSEWFRSSAGRLIHMLFLYSPRNKRMHSSRTLCSIRLSELHFSRTILESLGTLSASLYFPTNKHTWLFCVA